jgi:endonuclease YncB( thermonuclease family)
MKLSILLFALLLYGCNHPETLEYSRDVKNNTFKIIGVKDGDTVDLLVHGVKHTVRLANIDAPEKKQPFGKKAKQLLANLCFGKNVTLIHNNKYDRYKRLIAELITESGININKEMVSNGLAWHFKKYSSDTSYSRLEKITNENPIPPWEWRKLTKQDKLKKSEKE